MSRAKATKRAPAAEEIFPAPTGTRQAPVIVRVDEQVEISAGVEAIDPNGGEGPWLSLTAKRYMEDYVTFEVYTDRKIPGTDTHTAEFIVPLALVPFLPQLFTTVCKRLDDSGLLAEGGDEGVREQRRTVGMVAVPIEADA